MSTRPTLRFSGAVSHNDTDENKDTRSVPSTAAAIPATSNSSSNGNDSKVSASLRAKWLATDPDEVAKALGEFCQTQRKNHIDTVVAKRVERAKKFGVLSRSDAATASANNE